MTLATPILAQTADPDRVLSMPFPYVASETDLRDVLDALGRRLGLTVRMTEGLGGTVTIDNAQGDVRGLLREVSAQTGTIWWFDGAILRVEPADGLVTELVPTQGLDRAALERELRLLQIYDPRFAMTFGGGGAILRITGPVGYVAQVRSLVETLDATRRRRTDTPEEAGRYAPRVFYGRDG
jgi:type II secretory pathway component GspD/PulD (secretin)